MTHRWPPLASAWSSLLSGALALMLLALAARHALRSESGAHPLRHLRTWAEPHTHLEALTRPHGAREDAGGAGSCGAARAAVSAACRQMCDQMCGNCAGDALNV